MALEYVSSKVTSAILLSASLKSLTNYSLVPHNTLETLKHV